MLGAQELRFVLESLRRFIKLDRVACICSLSSLMVKLDTELGEVKKVGALQHCSNKEEKKACLLQHED